MSGIGSIAQKRLRQERALWRKDHPPGFSAKYKLEENDAPNPFEWECVIPGRTGTIWEGGEYALTMTFPKEYPSKPPKCKFKTVLFHPNIYPSGTVCLSILDEDNDWKPSITVQQILIGIQQLLENPNVNSPAQQEPLDLYRNDIKKYEDKVRKQAQELRPQE